MERPVVSVIVRTIGRATLARSIACALAQTWRPLEIVVVRAGGDTLPAFSRSPEAALRIVEGGSLTRPQAANVGIGAADGDWLMFLDDDDEIDSTHVETLMDAVLDSEGALVSYSATACVDASGRVDGVISQPFDRQKLFAQNYIQLGAALFSRTLVAEGYRFDESFESLQDWDFWIQLANRTHFAFTGQATNRWSMTSGDSGAGGAPNYDPESLSRFKAKLARKWAQWIRSLERRVQHHQRASRAAMAQGNVAQARAHLDAADRVLRGPVPRVRARPPGRPVAIPKAATAG